MIRPSGTNRPTIGAVIPAFNRQGTVRRAVQSALSQSRPPEQIVVVDDGSTDATREEAQRCAPAVEVITQSNSGPSVARNTGVAALDTEWVAFLDSDDHWTEGHLERIADAIEATEAAADVYFADSVAADLPGGTTWWQRCGFTVEGANHLVVDATQWVMRPLHPFRIQASAVRRSRYLEIGGLWPALRGREDTHMFFLLGVGRPFCAVAGIGVEITDDEADGRLTRSGGDGTEAYARHTVLMYEDILGRHPELSPGDRRVLGERLVDANLDLASLALRNRDPRGLGPLGRAMRLEPSHVVGRLTAVVRNRGRQRTHSPD